MTDLTRDRLREVLHYCPDTGQFTWRVSVNSNAQAGAIAGSKRADGRRVIRIGKKLHLAYRLAWLYTHGEWPQAGIDHRDGDCTNDRIANLRPADQSQNACNAKRQHNNRSGHKGVYWHSGRKKWRAAIKVRGKSHHLGYFESLKEAAARVAAARNDMHKDFARHE